jgi:hypothetical protein
MKKTLLFLAFTMITTLSSAQYTIWEDDFDDSDASDWILLDQDGNGSNWTARKNIQFDANTGAIVGGTYDVLGTYNIDLTNGGSQLETSENNLAISPVFDTSFYSGKITLTLNAQPSVYDTNEDILIYGSTSPDPASFTLIKTVTLERTTIEDAEFKDYTVDISQFAGKTEVYIAFGTISNPFIGYEIDKISIMAEALLGTDDNTLKSSLYYLKQNPVQDNLVLEIAEEYKNEETLLKIYNTSGVLLKESSYRPEGLSVSDLSQGIYFLSVNNNGASKKIKFIKK